MRYSGVIAVLMMGICVSTFAEPQYALNQDVEQLRAEVVSLKAKIAALDKEIKELRAKQAEAIAEGKTDKTPKAETQPDAQPAAEASLPQDPEPANKQGLDALIDSTKALLDGFFLKMAEANSPQLTSSQRKQLSDKAIANMRTALAGKRLAFLCPVGDISSKGSRGGFSISFRETFGEWSIEARSDFYCGGFKIAPLELDLAEGQANSIGKGDSLYLIGTGCLIEGGTKTVCYAAVLNQRDPNVYIGISKAKCIINGADCPIVGQGRGPKKMGK